MEKPFDRKACSEHIEMNGTAIGKGICPKCGRDLDVWFYIKLLHEKYMKIWARDLVVTKMLTPCCMVKPKLNERTEMYHCSKCGGLI